MKKPQDKRRNLARRTAKLLGTDVLKSVTGGEGDTPIIIEH